MPQFQVIEVDGKMTFHEMTPEEIRRDYEEKLAKEEARIAAGGCDHVGDWVHDYDPQSILGDAYFCAKCGQLMQVG